jgi:hypothetical protein
MDAFHGVKRDASLMMPVVVYLQNDAALLVSRLDIAVGLGGLVQRITPVND